MVFPGITLIPGVNTRTGWTVEFWLKWSRVMDVKTVMPVEMAGALMPAVKVGSSLDDILKPSVVAA